jgi:tungstate transport system ATP-binding protein
MDAVYHLEGVQKSYAGRCVLEIERLEVQRGEVLALVGPSGAGKSTLLRLLNFLEVPDQGLLYYRDQVAGADLPLALRREVTTVFQRPALLHDSVEHNVAFGLGLRAKRGQPDTRARVRAALERMGLEGLRSAPARTLSGGEAQRVALARALVLEPVVLLLDEPTANLDPYNVSLIEEVVREINRERGTTCVLVTHNIFQARRLADRVGLLLGGRLVELANAADFFENPRDPRTRAFANGEMVY